MGWEIFDNNRGLILLSVIQLIIRQCKLYNSGIQSVILVLNLFLEPTRTLNLAKNIMLSYLLDFEPSFGKYIVLHCLKMQFKILLLVQRPYFFSRPRNKLPPR